MRLPAVFPTLWLLSIANISAPGCDDGDSEPLDPGTQPAALPVFADPSFSALTGRTLAIALGDFDGDADLDLAHASQGGNGIWANDATGIFTLAQALPDHDTSALAIGDVDGDLDLDLVEGNYSETVLGIETGRADRVLVNGGAGIFTDSIQRLGNGFTRANALGDLDGDGDLDLVEGNQGENRVYENVGGDFRIVDPTFAKSRTTSVALGDLDGDGDLDLVQGNAAPSITSGALAGEPDEVHENDGAGNFRLVQQLGNELTGAVVLADLDGDTDLDLASGHEDGIDLYANTAGNLDLAADVVLPGEQVNALAAGDLDLDGDVDLVIGGERVSRPVLNGGGGFFAPQAPARAARTFAVELGDLNADGDLDLVTGEEDGFRVLPGVTR